MTAIHETAYPRIRSNLREQALHALSTPPPDDLTCGHRTMQSPGAAFGGGVLWQTLPRLGSFPCFDALPARLMQPLATTMGRFLPRETLQHDALRGLRKWHLPLMRDSLGLRAFGDGGRRCLVGAVLEASRSQDIRADIINVGLEALGPARDERPAFSPRRRAAQQARAPVQHRSSHQVSDVLDALQRLPRPRLLSREASETTSPWQRLTQEPKPPTPKRIRAPLGHGRWLPSLTTASQALAGGPATQLQRFAEEARAVHVARMTTLPGPQRHP